jgi:hypothetical protein
MVRMHFSVGLCVWQVFSRIGVIEYLSRVKGESRLS